LAIDTRQPEGHLLFGRVGFGYHRCHRRHTNDQPVYEFQYKACGGGVLIEVNNLDALCEAVANLAQAVVFMCQAELADT
jgi:hypothetical protein